MSKLLVDSFAANENLTTLAALPSGSGVLGTPRREVHSSQRDPEEMLPDEASGLEKWLHGMRYHADLSKNNIIEPSPNRLLDIAEPMTEGEKPLTCVRVTGFSVRTDEEGNCTHTFAPGMGLLLNEDELAGLGVETTDSSWHVATLMLGTQKIATMAVRGRIERAEIRMQQQEADGRFVDRRPIIIDYIYGRAHVAPTLAEQVAQWRAAKPAELISAIAASKGKATLDAQWEAAGKPGCKPELISAGVGAKIDPYAAVKAAWAIGGSAAIEVNLLERGWEPWLALSEPNWASPPSCYRVKRVPLLGGDSTER